MLLLRAPTGGYRLWVAWQVRVSKEEGNVTFSRSSLAQWLIEQARQRYPGSIKFHFGAECKAVDLQQRKVGGTRLLYASGLGKP